MDSATGKGTFVGTLQYMSPEQIQGADPDVRTDIFAFGVVLYEMLTGKKAFDAKTSASVVAKILETHPPPMSTVVPLAPPALDHVVQLCLAKDPAERWQNTHDVLAQLRWIEKDEAQRRAIRRDQTRRRPGALAAVGRGCARPGRGSARLGDAISRVPRAAAARWLVSTSPCRRTSRCRTMRGP